MDDQLREALDGAGAAHRRLLVDLEGLTDDQARAASQLTGWSRGHVLTHLARNADAFVRMHDAALRGQAVSQYDGGAERRAADIEAGAGRPAAELVADVADSIERLEQAWDRLTPEAWAGHGLNAAGEHWPCAAMPFHRWREVAVHHVDLGLGYDPGDWPADYVERELAVTLRLLPERLDAAGRPALLAWLLGRADQPRELELQPWQFGPEHYLR